VSKKRHGAMADEIAGSSPAVAKLRGRENPAFRLSDQIHIFLPALPSVEHFK
jgi:hypothetical protein